MQLVYIIALWVTSILFFISCLILLLSVVFLVECTSALLSKSSTSAITNSDRKAAIIVPAHNEEAGIRATLEVLVPELRKQDNLIVVADNCTDSTAAIARSVGGTVLERNNDSLRGKGYALDFGLRFLDENPPDVVIFVDADCQLGSKAIEHLVQEVVKTGRPVQAKYLMSKPSNPSLKDSFSAFSIKVKNFVRPKGLTHLGYPCLLTGSGMAFPWNVIRSVNLASGHIAEDMKLGLDLSLAGYPPTFCEAAEVVGTLPENQEGAKSQRTRWIHGELQAIQEYFPKLIKASVQQKRLDLLMQALDLCVSPLVLIVMAWSVLMAIAIPLSILTKTWISLSILSSAGLAILTAVIVSWSKFGRSELSASELLSLPLYLLWKIPFYLSFLVKPQLKWIRTKRD
jgi:cellulose synthase/poly-beta-1,6-N-acetylglucosamine synthase-like glycosyltransferase